MIFGHLKKGNRTYDKFNKDEMKNLLENEGVYGKIGEDFAAICKEDKVDRWESKANERAAEEKIL